MTPADRTAALSRLVHDEYLTLGGLSDIPQCLECAALSGLLTGLVQLARNGIAPESIEQLVAEAAETLGLVEPEPVRTPVVHAVPIGDAPDFPCCGVLVFEAPRDDRVSIEPARVTCHPAATTESMADHTTTTRVSLLGTAR